MKVVKTPQFRVVLILLPSMGPETRFTGGETSSERPHHPAELSEAKTQAVVWGGACSREGLRPDTEECLLELPRDA